MDGDPDNQHRPYDCQGKLIKVGDSVLAPFAKGGAGDGAYIFFGTVVAIEEPTHRGYGYWTRKLKLRGKRRFETRDQTVTHNYPANCLLAP